MANITKRRTEKTELTAVSITGEPKKLKATITYQQELTLGQMIGIGVSSVAAAGLGYYFGRLASSCKHNKIVKGLDKLFGIDEDEIYNDNDFEEDEEIIIEVDEVK